MTIKRVPHQRGVSTAARKVQIAPVETTSVTCGFCEGSGQDPFGIMSPLATCGICGGRGAISVRTPYATCAFCEGTGVYPGSRLTCTACGGLGVQSVGERIETCTNCLGTGMDRSSESGLYCLVCHGAGIIETSE